MLRVEGLSVSYGGKELVLKNVTITFDRKTLLLGPNGAGKTTFFRAICGITPKVSGKIYLDGVDLDMVSGKTGYVVANLPEIHNLLYVDAYTLLEVYMDLLEGDTYRALEILELFGLRESFLKKAKLHTMSAGQRKIFLNAIVLSTKARVKLLDEPFEQLDPAKKSLLIELLEKDYSLIILSTHETWLIEKLSGWDAAFMFEGQIHGKISVDKLLGLYVVYEADPNAVLTIRTQRVVISLVEEPKGRKLEDFMSLDYIYKLM